MLTFGIISIATRNYLNYWIDLVHSYVKNVPLDSKVTFHLFTDDTLRAKTLANEYPLIKFYFYDIESLGWPEATLLRYKIFTEHSQFLSEDVLIYLDSDMQIAGDFISALKPDAWKNGLAVVEHPGYYRPLLRLRSIHFLVKPSYLLSYIRAIRSKANSGPWEGNENSQAYVPPNARKIYCAGGAIFGLRSAFLEMSAQLMKAINVDSDLGIVAVWHDESHLNRYITQNDVSILSPEFCYEPTYPLLIGMRPLIIALDKGIVVR